VNRDVRVNEAALMKQRPQHIEEMWDRWARELGIPNKYAVRREALDNLRPILQRGKVTVRVPKPALNKILTDGRFRTQFETGKSGGLLNTDLRTRVERNLFGDLTPNQERPIYGYLDAFDTAADHEILDQYGELRVVLKDEVRDRTTWTGEDSLSRVFDPTAGEFVPSSVPSPLNDPHQRSLNTPTPPTDDPASQARNPERLRGGRMEIQDPEGWWGTTEDRGIFSAYIETQIHGGVSVSDIAEVIFPSEPSAAFKARLRKEGIPWRVAGS
jgi:hypothetical protein